MYCLTDSTAKYYINRTIGLFVFLCLTLCALSTVVYAKRINAREDERSAPNRLMPMDKRWSRHWIDEYINDGEPLTTLNRSFNAAPVRQYAPFGNSIKSIVRNDFLVNDDTGGDCDQSTPAVAISPSGRYIIAWCDARNGYYDVYAQIYLASGQPLGAAFKVNPDSVTTNHIRPSVAVTSDGSFVIAWEMLVWYSDYFLVTHDIYARQFDSLGAPRGTGFRVSDNILSVSHYWPRVAASAGNGFVVCWFDNRYDTGGYPVPIWDIFVQRYDNNGVALGQNIKVNDDSIACYRYYPTAAVAENGSFVVAWSSFFNIKAQCFDSSGTAVGLNFMVNDDSTTFAFRRRYPSIAMTPAGAFAITWWDNRNNSPNICCQRYTSSCVPSGPNFIVNDTMSLGMNPVIAMSDSGNFEISWDGMKSGQYSRLYAQRYNPAGSPIGGNSVVDDDTGNASPINPTIGMAPTGQHLIAWEDYRNGLDNSDIYFQRYDSIGNAIGVNDRTNVDSGTSWQCIPTVAVNPNGSFVAAWEDARSGRYAVYFQRYDASGSSLGSNIRACADTVFMNPSHRSHSIASHDSFIIAWHSYFLFFQRFNPSGAPIGSKVIVDSSTSIDHPAGAMSDCGSFIIIWEDVDNIYGKLYDGNGNPVTSKFKVNSDSITAVRWFPSVAMATNGAFTVCWEDYRSSAFEIYAQRYDSAGSPIGTNFKVSATTDQFYPAVAMDFWGNTAIAWQGGVDGSGGIMVQRYNTAGTAIGGNVKVNDDAGTCSHTYPSVAYAPSSGKYVVSWTDYRSPGRDPNIIAQVYDSAGNLDGTNIVVNATTDSTSLASKLTTIGGGCLGATDQRLIFAWQDTRRRKGWDVYSKVTDWNVTGIGLTPIANNNTGVFCLFQNSPNPTSGQTIFRYQLSCPGRTTFTIYNTLGQVVRTLVNQNQQSGIYNVNWNGCDDQGRMVASGVYFYHIKSGLYKAFKKLVLLR